jgi:hypothetical protein
MLMFRMRLAVLSIVSVLCLSSAWGQDRAPAQASKGRAPVGSELTCPGCDDWDACTIDSCDTNTGTCRHDPLFCDDGNPCTDDSCRSNTMAVGGCFHFPRPNATPCDDGETCTLGESCSEGVCVPGEVLGRDTACDDGNPCTVSDACDPFAHCAGTPLGAGAGCDDRSACTRDDRCVEGPEGAMVCEGTGQDCSDGNLCTEDRCDPATGQCLHPSIDCADGNTCTTDVCDPATGLCRRDNVAGGCSDGLYCNIGETCLGGNCVGGAPIVCPQPQCGSNVCFQEDGGCRLRDWGGNGCPAGGECFAYACINNHCQVFNSGPDPCDPHDPTGCSRARCVRGQCQLDITIPCNDSNPCTEDVCTSFACDPRPKADGTPCASLCTTGGVCQSGVCTDTTPVSCDDGNPCTRDSCDAASGCRHDPGGCDDGNPCTTDSCFQSNTCRHVTLGIGATCDDGNTCTHNDTCLLFPEVGIVCAGDPSCDDGNPCTTDARVLEGDTCVCRNAPVESACCSEGNARSCDDNNPCTADRCDPAIGCVHAGIGIPNPPPETCNGLDDDCDGQVDERELYPMCAVRPLVMRDSGTSKTFTVTCRWKPACPGAPVPAPLDEIHAVWLSAADLLLDPADNAPLPNPISDCNIAIVEDPAKRMTGDAAVTFVFDEDGDGVCGTGGLGREGLMFYLADVPDGKLARVCVRSSRGGSERCGIVLVRHDTATEPQPVNPGEEERRILLPAP